MKRDVETQAAARNAEGSQSSRGTHNEGGTDCFVGQSMPREEIYSSGGSSRGEVLSSGGSSTQTNKRVIQSKGLPVMNDSDDDDDDEEEEQGKDVERKGLMREELGAGRVVDGQGSRRSTGFRQKTTTAAEEEREYRELYALPTPHTGGSLRDEVDNTVNTP